MTDSNKNNDSTTSSSPDNNGSDHNDSRADSNTNQTTKIESKKRIESLEAKALAEATATADSQYVPSTSLMNSNDPLAMLGQVDGLSDLSDYEEKESVYVGRSVPISAGGSLEIPIQVATPGSVVEYSVENKQYDFGFSITAERDGSITIVKEETRMNAKDGPITGKFLVGSVPCWIRFKFDNGYSWIREKVVSYKVTVTPPSSNALRVGRRRRAKACLKAVSDDSQSADKRRRAARDQLTVLESEVEQLRLELTQKSKSLQAAKDEEKWCLNRLKLRKEQKQLLDDRLENGWEDEQSSSEHQEAEEEE